MHNRTDIVESLNILKKPENKHFGQVQFNPNKIRSVSRLDLEEIQKPLPSPISRR
jgi:hypothetical protein